jgi:hypothetical protein
VRAPKQVAENVRADNLPGRAANNLVHSERFRMYNVLIWAVKTEIVAIAPTLGRPRKTECCSVQEYGGVL